MPYEHQFKAAVLGEDSESVVVAVPVRLERCGDCRAPVVRARDLPWCARFGGWTAEIGAKPTEGMEVAGLGRICVDCAAHHKATVTCELCKEQRPRTEVQEDFGFPAVYLCRSCYETVPAKQWDENRERLEEEHRHDLD